MQNKYLIVSIIVVLVLSLNLFLAPHKHKQAAFKVVKTVLNEWQEGVITKAKDYWINPKKYPPVYGLNDWEILEHHFGKKDKIDFAYIFVKLDLSKESMMPTDKEWIFILNDTKTGWKISEFRLATKIDYIY